MSSRYEYGQFSGAGDVNNERGAVELVANPGAGQYLYVEKIHISVYRAAAGGGGLVQVLDTSGTPIWAVSADGVKDLTMDFGDEGLRIGPALGLQAVSGGANGDQASANVGVIAHSAFR